MEVVLGVLALVLLVRLLSSSGWSTSDEARYQREIAWRRFEAEQLPYASMLRYTTARYLQEQEELAAFQRQHRYFDSHGPIDLANAMCAACGRSFATIHAEQRYCPRQLGAPGLTARELYFGRRHRSGSVESAPAVVSVDGTSNG